MTCGIKASGAPDLALLACDGAAVAAGAFTRSRLAAAPVLRVARASRGRPGARRGRQLGQRQRLHRRAGHATTRARWRAATARALGIAPDEVVVCSTGVIGKPLPMDAIAQGIARAAGELSESGGAAAADAIRTTDAWAKTSTATVALSGGRRAHRRDGQGRGHDPPRRGDDDRGRDHRREQSSRALLAELLRGAADASLNLVSVDGSESTNDTLVVLASGASGVSRARRRSRARSARR